MTSLTIEQKRVDIYPSAKPGSPVIYLNTFSNAVNSVYKNLMALGCPDFCLVAVSKLKWDHDMTPWYMGPISKHDTPCTGGADDYLKLLLDEIMPEAEALLPGAPAWRASPVTRWPGCSPSTLSTKRMCLPAQRVCQVPSGLRASWNMCAPMR